MKLRYLAGYVDPEKNKYYPSVLTNHKGNAEQIIRDRGWYDYWKNDPVTCKEAPDYLMFRRGFIQIGNCNNKQLLGYDKFYQNSYKVWEILYRTFSKESELELLKTYKFLSIMFPKY